MRVLYLFIYLNVLPPEVIHLKSIPYNDCLTFTKQGLVISNVSLCTAQIITLSWSYTASSVVHTMITIIGTVFTIMSFLTAWIQWNTKKKLAQTASGNYTLQIWKRIISKHRYQYVSLLGLTFSYWYCLRVCEFLQIKKWYVTL